MRQLTAADPVQERGAAIKQHQLTGCSTRARDVASGANGRATVGAQDVERQAAPGRRGARGRFPDDDGAGLEAPFPVNLSREGVEDAAQGMGRGQGPFAILFEEERFQLA